MLDTFTPITTPTHPPFPDTINCTTFQSVSIPPPPITCGTNLIMCVHCRYRLAIIWLSERQRSKELFSVLWHSDRQRCRWSFSFPKKWFSSCRYNIHISPITSAIQFVIATLWETINVYQRFIIFFNSFLFFIKREN